MTGTVASGPCALVVVQPVEPDGVPPEIAAEAVAIARAAWEEGVAGTGGAFARGAVVGWFAVWSDAGAALRAVTELQNELLARSWPEAILSSPSGRAQFSAGGRLVHRGVAVRAAMHHAAPDTRLGSDGYEELFGPPVHQVARVLSVALPGQTLVTDSAWRAVVSGLPKGVLLQDIGAHRLAGLLGAVRLFHALPESLSEREFGPLRSLLEAKNNLLRPHRPIYGRTGDLAALRELLGMGARVISVVGEPGMGRSKLVRQLAWDVSEIYRADGGTWYVDARVGSTAVSFAWAAGMALDLPLVIGRTVDDSVRQLGRALAARRRTLVILDGFVHEPEPISVLSRCVELAPEARFVVVTTERLRLACEIVYNLDPLPVSEGGPAVRLLRDRVRDLGWADAEESDVLPVVRRLRGHPLALLLASTLLDGPTAASTIQSALPPQSPRKVAAILGSLAWERLTPAEQHVVAHLALLPRRFGIQTVEAVVEPRLGLFVRAVFEDLIRKGVVRESHDASTPGVHCYAMHARLGAFVRGHVSADRVDTIEARFADAVLQKCEPWAGRAAGVHRVEVLARLAAEGDNLVLVARRGLERRPLVPEWVNRAVRAILVLAPVLEARGPFALLEELLDLALRACDTVLGTDPVLHVRALVARAEARLGRWQAERAEAELARAQEIAGRWGDEIGLANCEAALGEAAWQSGKLDRVEAHLQKAAEMFRTQARRRREGLAVAVLGSFYAHQGRLVAASEHLELALSVLRDTGALSLQGRALGDLGSVYRRLGRVDEARTVFRQAIRLHEATGERRRQAMLLGQLGMLDYHLGHLAEAASMYEASLQLSHEVGDTVTEAEHRANLALVRIEERAWEQARHQLLQATELLHDTGEGVKEATVQGLLGMLHHLRDAREAARRYYADAIRRLEDLGDARHKTLFVGWMAMLEAADGDVGKARTLLDLAKLFVAGTDDAQLRDALEVMTWGVDVAEGGRDAAAEVSLQLDRVGERPRHGELRLCLSFVRDWARAVAGEGSSEEDDEEDEATHSDIG